MIFSSDKPLHNPKNDRLGYSAFAKAIAKSICNMLPTEGLVMGIYGAWGSGKSTAANFIAHYLKDEEFLEKEFKEKDSPIIINFNPWWFSGKEDLTKKFFDLLQIKLELKGIFDKKFIKNINNLANLVSLVPNEYGFVAKILNKCTSPKYKSVEDLKAEIGESLSNKEKKILVIIDDIDRLASDEITQLFKVIKSIADLPYITYLLCFDKKVVVKSLDKFQGLPGEAYLEKIVQVPFELPLPDKALLRKLFFEDLNSILEPLNQEIWDATHWGNVFHEGVDPFISSPRDVNRLVNALKATYPAVENEVNPVDFVAIETLRVFCPEVYGIIRENKEFFVGVTNLVGGAGDAQFEKIKKFHDSWVVNVDEARQVTIKEILQRLFPVLKGVWGNTSYGPDWENEWAEKLRICSERYFDIYFRLSFPAGEFSQEEIETILKEADDPELFANKLQELAEEKHPKGGTRLGRLLEILEYFTENKIALEKIPNIIEAFFLVGDKLIIQEDESGLFSLGNKMKARRIIYQLIFKIDKERRDDVLKKAFESAPISSFVIDNLFKYGRELGGYGKDKPLPENEQTLTLEVFKDIEKIISNKIEMAAEDGSLLNIKELSGVLFCWKDNLSGGEKIKAWVGKIIADNNGLTRFLEGFLSSGMA